MDSSFGGKVVDVAAVDAVAAENLKAAVAGVVASASAPALASAATVVVVVVSSSSHRHHRSSRSSVVCLRTSRKADSPPRPQPVLRKQGLTSLIWEASPSQALEFE